MPIAVVVLAAGKGTRMRSDKPKVLHEIGHVPMLHHALGAALALEPERVVVVAGHSAEAVTRATHAMAPEAVICVQEQQLGTGHAVLAAAPALDGFAGDLLVLYGDTPLLDPASLAKLRAGRGTHALMVLGFEAADPGRYGRLLIREDGALAEIVEAKDATPEQLAIPICNSGVITGDCQEFFKYLRMVTNQNAQGEFYLTDVPALAAADGRTTGVVLCDEAETKGINNRAELADAEGIFQEQARAAAMCDGATLIAPDTVFFAADTELGRDVVVEPHVVFGPGVTVAEGARIRAFSHLEGASVGPHAIVGPYARLRPGTQLGEHARIGNFVEIKNAEIGAGAKANHLTYVGDASVGADANLGAGTITCNYDGVSKHRTEIGARAFVGVNTALIAPVTVGDGAYVATGTVVTQDVNADALAIARTPQQNREGSAKRLRQVLAARKASQNGKKE
ncbi:MAG: bifunctional UDP-N-acetylglucosamine diphosphorylase/glucosamine-1-phosphate N-acetyltransferase GlmU [Pseudomonadota bacterium]